MGNGFISRSVQRICLESAIPVSSSRAKPSIFLAHRYSAVCVIAEKGKPFVKGARKSGVQGRFLAALEMTVCGNEGSHKFEISNKLTNVKESHLNMSIIMCYIKTSIKAPMLLY